MIGKLQLTASMNCIYERTWYGMVWYFRGTSKVQLQEIQDIPKNFTHSCAPPIQQNKFCFNLIWT